MEFIDTVITDLTASLKILTGTTPDEKRLDWNKKIIDFIIHVAPVGRKFNFNSFFTEKQPLYRDKFIETIKSIALHNFTEFAIEINQDCTRFRKISK